MAESTREQPAAARAWQRLSPSLVPLLAVLTALLITVPFMILTGGEGDIGRGLNIAGTAYSALVEGSLGVVINGRVTENDLDQFLALAQSTPLTRSGLRTIARAATDIATIGGDAARRYGEVLAKLGDLSDDDIEAIADSLPDIAAIGTDRLDAMRPLIAALSEMERSDVSDLAEQLAALTAIPPDLRADLLSRLAVIDQYEEADFLAYMKLVDEYGIVRLQRLVERLDVLSAAGIEPITADGALSADAQELVNIAASTGGVGTARSAAEAIQQLDAAGIVNAAALSQQIETVRALYSGGLLTEDDVTTAINTELDAALQNNLVVSRPGNRLLIDLSNNAAGIIFDNNNTPDDLADDRTDALYLRLGGSALLFFPANLANMLIRAIPFIIAGLAVALGFKAGLFNIGAEGQLYAGGIFAVWVGYSPIFADLPLIVHLPLVIVAGVLGGSLWGVIPGALKAFTGAHEVIVTIMLNYIAVLLVDWLIKSTNPIILLDPAATTPRTPYLVDSARVPTFSSIPIWVYFLAGVATLVFEFYQRRRRIGTDIRYAIRPLVIGLVVTFGGLFLALLDPKGVSELVAALLGQDYVGVLTWIGSEGRLHIGFLLMLVVVRFTDWFLNRTTLGFELRTVGANPNAARYAGMSVKRNVILAMALSGALAGLAGTIEIAGVQFNMQPAFFSGLGFDAIAVALLARTNPRNMIVAGLLWGSLLSGAGLMQVRADISIDLVKIIQALIIMFIAADAIIRYLWRVPQPSEKAVSTFSKGWGS